MDNPLIGLHGASNVFGPQKGADREDVLLLDAALERFAEVLERDLPGCPAGLGALPGGGAAGGLGAAMLALGGHRASPGIGLVTGATGLDAALDARRPGDHRRGLVRPPVAARQGGRRGRRGGPRPGRAVRGAGRQVSTGRREAAAAGVTEAYSLVEHFGGEEAGAWRRAQRPATGCARSAPGWPGSGAAERYSPVSARPHPGRPAMPIPPRGWARPKRRTIGTGPQPGITGRRVMLASASGPNTAQGDFHVTTPAQTESTEAQAPTSVVLTDVAAQKVKALIEQEGRDDLRLRVAVQPGGCSGLRYQLFFDERSLDGDVVTDFGGVEVVVDRMSAPTWPARRSTSPTGSTHRASPSTTRTRATPAPAATRSTESRHTPARRRGRPPGRPRRRVGAPVGAVPHRRLSQVAVVRPTRHHAVAGPVG